MASGIEVRNAAGAVIFSTASQTWSFVDSFIVPSGYSSGTILDPASGSYLDGGNCVSVTAPSTDPATINSRSWFWNGTYLGYTTSGNTLVVNGVTYYMDTNNTSGWSYDFDYGNYNATFGIYRTYVGQIMVPQVVTKTYPSLSLMSEVIMQRSAVDNPPNNQEGYIHNAVRSGNTVTVSGGNIRTLVTVLGR